MNAKLLTNVMTHHSLASDPPILVDIGASGSIHPQWKEIAKFSKCIAFDAESRAICLKDTGFKELNIVDKLVASTSGKVNFMVTKDLQCSSTLKPQPFTLKRFTFAHLFGIKKEVTLSSVTLTEALSEVGLTKIDWIKIDTQGTDVRIFNSLSLDLRQRILVAEFEPALVEMYCGQDKLEDLLGHLDLQQSFFLADMQVKGSPRLKAELIDKVGTRSVRKATCRGLKRSPCWVDLTYIKDIDLLNTTNMLLRDWLLLWVCAMTEKQIGYAYEVVIKMGTLFSDPIVSDLLQESKKALRIAQIRGYLFPFTFRLKRLASSLHRAG